MKKFLAIFLIAIVACEAVQELELETIKWKWFPHHGETKVDPIKKVLEWLKANGYYDIIKKKIIELGKNGAIALCSNYLGQELCEKAVEAVCKYLGY